MMSSTFQRNVFFFKHDAILFPFNSFCVSEMVVVEPSKSDKRDSYNIRRNFPFVLSFGVTGNAIFFFKFKLIYGRYSRESFETFVIFNLFMIRFCPRHVIYVKDSSFQGPSYQAKNSF